MSAPVAKPARWAELDGLRCLAVAGVLAVHFAPGRFASTPWGDWGVRLFFVLSGFLITDGLLRLREEQPPGRALRDFFFRRALRLWPLYFATLAVICLCDLPGARALLPWNLGFATNIHIYLTGIWPGLMSHFWTLAVEQQFYLLWPFLLLFVAPSRALPVVLALLIASPLLRAWEFSALRASHPRSLSILLPMCADYLAWGALLAFLRRADRVPPAISRHGGAAGTILFVVLWWIHSIPEPSAWRFTAEASLLGVAAALLVAHCVGPRDSALRRILRLRPLVYLGGISYGVYVLHNFAHRLGPSILRRLTGRNYFEAEWAHVAWLVALSVLAAAASWHLFEQPISRLGRRALARAATSPATLK